MNTASGDGAGPAQSTSRNLLVRVGTAAILIPLALAAAWAGGWIWLCLVTLVAAGLYLEWLHIVDAQRPPVMVVGLFALVGAGVCLGIGRIGATSIVCAMGLSALALISAHRRLWAVLGLNYAFIALVASIMVRRDPEYGFVALLFVFLVVWASDIGGYFAGRGIGGPKLAPYISPNKTWAGAIGGFVLSLVMAAGFVAAGQGALLPLLALASVLSVASQCGDLFESAVKRRFGIKDSGRLIPGHGGLLDRLDGFVAAVMIAAIIGLIRGGSDGAGRGLMVW